MTADASLAAVLGVTLASSFVICALLVLTQKWHGRLSLDSDMLGAQKVHDVPVPRIGGLGLFAGLLAGIGGLALFTDSTQYQPILLLIVAGTPAFVAGLTEDITKRVSVSTRLFATFISAALAAWLLDAQLTRLDTVGLDPLMTITPIALVFTCFAVGGVANAVNIIDGFNGLASGCVLLMLSGLGAIAYAVGDMLVLRLCLIGAVACAGFMLLNYPFGKIFLGDGGAYLAGFWLAECAVLLLSRNDGVSTWAVLLACIYPVWETLFSIWRKDIHRKTGMGRPDRVHFHMLVYRRWISLRLGRHRPAWMKHGLTSALIWAKVLACQIAAVAMAYYDQNSLWVVIAIAAYVAFYIALYRSLLIRCDSTPDLLSSSSAAPAG